MKNHNPDTHNNISPVFFKSSDKKVGPTYYTRKDCFHIFSLFTSIIFFKCRSKCERLPKEMCYANTYKYEWFSGFLSTVSLIISFTKGGWHCADILDFKIHACRQVGRHVLKVKEMLESGEVIYGSELSWALQLKKHNNIQITNNYAE